jgi:hypothetical protein
MPSIPDNRVDMDEARATTGMKLTMVPFSEPFRKSNVVVICQGESESAWIAANCSSGHASQ